MPDSPIAQALLDELGEPMMTVTLIMPGDEYPLTDPYDIRQTLECQVDAIIDGGYCGLEPTTVVDMTGDQPADDGVRAWVIFHLSDIDDVQQPYCGYNRPLNTDGISSV